MKIRTVLEKNETYMWVFKFLYKGMPVIVFVVYGMMLLWLLWHHDERLGKVVAVPFIVFMGITLIRKGINAPRPYEVTGIPPLIPKEKKGQSFPSRHVVSAVVIAMAGGYLNLWLGVGLMFISICIACMRVIAGVHFIKDVVAGAVVSIAAGYIGFWI